MHTEFPPADLQITEEFQKHREGMVEGQEWVQTMNTLPPQARVNNRMPERVVDALLDYRDLMVKCANRGEYRAEVRPGDPLTVRNHHGEEFDLRLRFLDTPGLDDSKGRDDEFMPEVLTKMGAQGDADLLAFVFVVRAGATWSGGFLSAAKRYWEQFPDFRPNWIFLHTAIDPYLDKDYQPGNTYEEACELRKAKLMSALAANFGGDVKDLMFCPHVFIENEGYIKASRVRGDSVGKRELQLLARAQAVNKLLNNIASNSPVEMKDLPFLKSPKVLEKDRELRGVIEGIKEGMKGTLRVVAERLEAGLQRYTELSDRRDAAVRKLDRINDRLNDIDKDGTKTLDKKDVDKPGSWAIWAGWNEEQSLHAITDFPGQVSRVADKSSNYSYGDFIQAPLEFSGNAVHWKPSVTSPIWCGVGYTFKLEISYRDYHKTEIADLKKSRHDQQSDLDGVVQELAKTSSGNSRDEQMRMTLNKRIDVLDKLGRTLSRDRVSVSEWSRPGGFAQFYKWYQEADDSGKERISPKIVLVRYGNVIGLDQSDLDDLLVDNKGGPTKASEVLAEMEEEEVDPDDFQPSDPEPDPEYEAEMVRLTDAR